MKKKNDKVVILLVIFLIYLVMSWIVEGGMYSSGKFTSLGVTPVGIYDLLLVVYSAFVRVLPDVIYLLVIGGAYSVLSKTRGYRKLVDKTANLIKGKEAIALVIVTLLMGAYTSVTSQILTLFCVSPFIVSVFLRNGKDRITAISAGFGGLFIGYLGLTFGTYGITYLNSVTGLEVSDWIITKVIVFAVAFILFNIFAILNMKKNADVNETKYDMFLTEELDETKVKKRKRTKVWPTAIVMLIGLIVIALGYVDWTESFGIKLFTEIHTSFSDGFKVADIPLFSTFIGSYMKAFGEWEDLLNASFVVLIVTGIISLINKVDIETLTTNFGKGMRKISRVAFIYVLAESVAFLIVTSPWPNTIINSLFGSGSFNIFIILLIAIIAQILLSDPNCFSEMFGSYLTLTFADNLIATGLIWRLGSAIAFIVGPTSFLLLSVLTYLDVPYSKWLKYIWKFVASFMLVVLLVLAVIIYV